MASMAFTAASMDQSGVGKPEGSPPLPLRASMYWEGSAWKCVSILPPAMMLATKRVSNPSICRSDGIELLKRGQYDPCKE